MTISVLGPLQVTVAGRNVALPAKQRTLLAILALQVNRVVPQHRLIEAGWGEDASSGLTKTLQSHVFQLRRALSLSDDAADAADCEPRIAVALLERALGLWRGPDVADVGDEPAVRAEIQQLEWLRLSAIEDLARLRLALGEHEQVVPELRRALAEAPYNEQLWASLMIALARSGKRAEALIAFQQARAAL